YNLFGRPYEVSKDGQSERLTRVPESLARISSTIDAVTFAEADIDSERNAMLAKFRKRGFPYATSILHDPDPFTSLLNGGVLVVSKWPVVREAQHVYRDACHYSDCLAAKGVKYARLLKTVNGTSKIFNVFATHMQVNRQLVLQANMFTLALIEGVVHGRRSRRSNSAGSAGEKAVQVDFKVQFPLIFAGDFNVDNHTFGSEVAHLVELLGSHEPLQIGAQLFTSEYDLSLCKWLDYVLFGKGTDPPYQQPSIVPTLEAHVNQVPHFTVDWTAAKSNMKMALIDISDHYPVLGKFAFPVTQGPGKDDDPLTYHLDGCSTDADCHFRDFRCYCNGANCYYQGNHTSGWDLDSQHPVNRNCLYQKTSFRCLCGPT
ncbi:hypothetical protein BBJ28_00022570, partial [Nothophytophthora sp. Chile5]